MQLIRKSIFGFSRYIAQVLLLFLGLIISMHCTKPQLAQPVLQYKSIEPENSQTPEININKLNAKIKTVVINFFAPDCPPCLEELPDMQKIYSLSKKENADFVFLAVGSSLEAIADETMSNLEIINGLKIFQKQYDIQYPIYFTSANELRKMGITGFPETFVLERAGAKKKPTWKLRRKFISVVSESEIVDLLENRDY